MLVQIRNSKGHLLFECEALSLKQAVVLAVEKKINLKDAQLENADLSFCSLQRGYFVGANFKGALLMCTDFMYANLDRANFQNANMSGVYLMFTSIGKTNFDGVDETIMLSQNKIS